MARDGRSRKGADGESQLRTRIDTLCELVWAGNRSRMARDLQIDQATISRVHSGKQPPSAKLLERLATWEGVNVVWLFQGQGEPLVESDVKAGLSLPIVDELLPVPPSDREEQLTGGRHPVAAAFYSETAYWHRVPSNAPIARASGAVLAGDLLLVDTDTKWTRSLRTVYGKFCVFRVNKGRRERVLLGKIKSQQEYHEPYETYTVDTFGESEDLWLVVADTAAGMKQGHQAVSGVGLGLEQVAGVCLQLERPYEWSRSREACGV